jgi:hypothetical protein
MTNLMKLMMKNSETFIQLIAEEEAMVEAKAGVISENEARWNDFCVCGAEKDHGCVVCWNCFKYIPNGLKYFQGSFEEWQEARRNRQ